MLIKRYSFRLMDSGVMTSEPLPLDQETITIQDHTTSTRAMVERLANGVINEQMLNNGATYSDFGLPANMDRFDVIDLARATNVRVQNLQQQLTEQEDEPAPEQPAPEQPAPEQLT